MIACKWRLFCFMLQRHTGCSSTVIIRDACMTGQMEYQKLYFENGASYKYYIRKHMQILKIQNRLLQNFSFFSTGVAKRLLLAGNCSAMKASDRYIFQQNHYSNPSQVVCKSRFPGCRDERKSRARVVCHSRLMGKVGPGLAQLLLGWL